MPHTFDTGGVRAQRTLIRNAVIARLAPLLRSANPAKYIASVKSLARPYRGEGDVEGLDMLWGAFNGAAPAIGVALGRMPFEPVGGSPLELRGDLSISIYAASQHQRDLVDGRLAADVTAMAANTADPGVETMLEHIAERLLGQGLGVAGVAELRGEEEDIVATFGDVTIGELRLTVNVTRDVNPARAVTQLVTSIENKLASSDIPAGNVHDPLVTTVSSIVP